MKFEFEQEAVNRDEGREMVGGCVGSDIEEVGKWLASGRSWKKGKGLIKICFLKNLNTCRKKEHNMDLHSSTEKVKRHL